MAAARSDNIIDVEQLQMIFFDISKEDCELLLEEFEGNNIEEITQNVYDTLESSRFTSVKDMIWHIKQDPSFGFQRGGSVENLKPKKDSWSLAKSKSSNTMNKQLSQPPAVRMQPMPYSGTKNPVKILRSSRSIEPYAIQPYLTKYMQDPQMRNLLYDIYECRYPKLLVLMRGASGSGKSTLASIMWAITEQGEICSADHYFMSHNGHYKFSRSFLGEAHESCRNRCKLTISRGDSPIIIDNTNTRIEEMLPYVQMAVENNYEIKIAEPKTDWKTKAGILAQKTTHSVPKRTIEDQLDRFEKATEKSLIDRVAKRVGGNKTSTFKPGNDLDWGRNVCPPTETWEFSQSTQKPELITMMNSLAVSSPTKTKSPVQSPSPTQSAPISWTEHPANGPPASILLSDLVPDLTLVNNGSGPKSKRSAKRNGASNSETAKVAAQATPVPFEDPAHLKFEKLRMVFPTVPVDELDRIFNLYEGDVDHCASALMDEGVEMTGITESSLANETKCDTQEAEFDNVWDTQTNYKDHCNVDNYKETMSSSTDELEDNEDPASLDGFNYKGQMDDDSFEMILPVEFARLLLCEYGHPDDERRSMSLDELTIKVPVDVAFEIYKSLYLNMHKTESEGRSSSPNSSTRSNSPTPAYMEDEFNAMAIGLSQMEMETDSENPQQKLSTESELSPEMLQLYSARNRTMAQNINFCMLKQEYVFLDEVVVDEIYTQCFLNADKTRSWLNEMFPQSVPQSFGNKTVSDNNAWHLKYNPKDVLMYSPDDLKEVQRTYDKLEDEWLNKMAKMRDYYQKCQNMSSSQIKAHYISEAKKISDEIKNITEEMQYFKALNINAKHKNDQILDLHGLKINGAMRVLKEFLQCKVAEFINTGTPKMILLIITGKGNHSRNGCPVLQPAVRNFLTQRGYQFHAGKPGSYTVVLTRSFITRRKQAGR